MGKKRSKQAAKDKKAKEGRTLRKVYYVIFFSAIILFSFLVYNRQQKLKGDTIETSAKVIDIKRNVPKGKLTTQSYAIVEYFVNEVKMENRSPLYSNAKIGTCYKMIYTVDSPEVFDVDFDQIVNCKE